MSTATRSSGARNKSSRKKPPGNAGSTSSALRRSLPIVVGLVIAAVVVALIVALGSGDDNSGQQSNEAARIPSGSLRQVSFAETQGPALPRFDSAQLSDPAVGSLAPTINASYFDGTDVSIDPTDGRPRILLFLAHWCPHCQAEAKSLGEWFVANGLPAGVDVIAISTNVDEGAPNYPPSDWFLREQWPVPILRDSADNDLASGYGLSGFPYLVILNGDGQVEYRQTGSMTIPQWEALVATAEQS